MWTKSLVAAFLLACSGSHDTTTDSGSDVAIPGEDAGSGVGIPSSLFGFVVNNASDTKPQLPFGTWRVWDDNAQWPMLQPDGGTFDWAPLDPWLSAIVKADPPVTDVVYTFMRVPDWAATQTDQYYDGGPVTCNYSQYPAGGVRNCYPPSDLASDGSGADLIWRKAVAAIGAHIAQALPGRRLYWTLWDEIYRSTTLVAPSVLPPAIGNGQMSWEGTYAQLVRVFQDASCILNGNAKMVTATSETCAAVQASVGLTGPVAPGSFVLSPGGSGLVAPLSFAVVQQFLYCNVDAGLTACPTGSAGAAAVDGINFEQYVFGSAPLESKLPNALAAIDALLQPPEKSKPLFSAEGSWGKSLDAPDGGVANGPYRDSYVARYYLLLASGNVTHAVWYAYDEPAVAGLYDPGTNRTLPGASAWNAVYGWLVGSTFTSPCAVASGSLWTCGLSLGSGERALAVWDSSATCSETGCATTNIPVPAGGYTHYRDLAGNTNTLGQTIPVGLQPILLTQE